MKSMEFDIDGDFIRAQFEVIDGRLWIHARGLTWDVGPETKTAHVKRGPVGGVGDGRDVRAPMPGKLAKISVKVGDKISKGQVVAVIEAMKMEYTLKAIQDGLVKRVCREMGSQVTLDEVLLEIDTSQNAED
ncbi:MAG: acetyl-CoA carboxylase biotin carboxyl carrier protein subunit [Bdellovibrionia bacterium]